MFSKAQITETKKLHQKKYRKEYGQFIVEGLKGVQEAIDANAKIVSIFATQAVRHEIKISKDLVIETITETEGQKMTNTETFPGVMAIISIPTDQKFSHGHIVCLDRVSDPGNMGTIIRTADWFGIKNILISEDSVDPYNPKVVRSSMGSIFHTSIIETENLIEALRELKKNKYNIVSLDMEGKDISKIKVENNTVYVFGSESHGVREEILELGDSYSILGHGDAESLNVAVSVGITLNQVFGK